MNQKRTTHIFNNNIESLNDYWDWCYQHDQGLKPNKTIISEKEFEGIIKKISSDTSLSKIRTLIYEIYKNSHKNI